jgi:urease gamma subunit
MSADHTLRMLEASAVWARQGGQDHRTVAAMFRNCAHILKREVAGDNVKSLVDEVVRDLETYEGF